MPTLDEVAAARAAQKAKKSKEPEPESLPIEPAGVAQPSGSREHVQRESLAEQEDWLNALWYGPGGTGKTTALASMAKLGGRIIMINAESGIKRRALERMGIPVDGIELVPSGRQDLSYQLIDDLFWELKADIETGRSAYIGVAWDSLTDIVKLLLQQVIAKRVQRAIRRGESNQLVDPFFTDLADYGPMSEQVRTLIRRYRDLPIHFAASALERRDTDNDGAVLYRPAVTPALYQDLDLYMDTICHTEVAEAVDGEPVFLGLFRPIGKFRGKDRFKVMPDRIVDPTFDRVYGYVTEEIEVDNDPVQKEGRARLYDTPPAATTQEEG